MRMHNNLGSKKRLKNSVEAIYRSRTVILVGAGNIGSHVAMELPLIGAKRIVLIDSDHIEARNLQCCSIFSLSDIGQAKVEVLASRIQKTFPTTELLPLCTHLNEIGLAQLRDETPFILVGAVDSRRSRYELAKISVLLGMPLIDLAITPYETPLMARAQITWWQVKHVDPLDAWSTQDWTLLEQVQPCSKSADSGKNDHPTSSSISGLGAGTLGLAEVQRLWRNDNQNVGHEIRFDLTNHSFVRCLLPNSGLSPLDKTCTIENDPFCCEVDTLQDLLCAAQNLIGQNAQVVLNRSISPKFMCRQCNSIRSKPAPINSQTCDKCGSMLIAAEPLTSLCNSLPEILAQAPVRCLGVERDILRVISDDSSKQTWLEYKRS